jgi:hypothetical protein
MTLPNTTEPKTPPTPPNDATTGYIDPAAPVDTPVVTTPAEPELDENGYTKVAKPEEDPKDPPAKEPEADPEVKDPATGYGDDPEPEPKKEPKEEPKDPASEEGKLNAQMDESLGELPEGYNKDILKQFALDNKMSPEQVKAYVELTKSEEAQSVEDNASAVREQRAAWKKQLVNDVDFGGENFVKNNDRVEKVLDKHFPEWKKELTGRGKMLPPYIMKDLLGLAKTLNPTTSLEKGDPSEPVVKDDGNFLDEMYQ